MANARVWIYATAVTNEKWLKKRGSINIFDKISTFYEIKMTFESLRVVFNTLG